VKVKAQEKSRGYLLIGIVAMLLTVIVIVVVALTTSGATPTASGPLHLHVRASGQNGVDCLMLPHGSAVTVTSEAGVSQQVTLSGCDATVDWPLDWRVGQTAQVTLEDAGGFVLDRPASPYKLGNPRWELAVHAAPTTPRLLVQIFNYPGEGPVFEQFYAIVSSKIRVLGDAIARDHPDCAYMKDLHAEKAGRDETSGANQTLEEWRSSNALLFLSGLFYRRGPDEFVRSLPYFGELAPQAGELDRLQLDLGIDMNELGQTTDSHSLAVLYALAMDARRIGRPKDVILTFLGQAVSVAQGVDSAVPGVATLKAQLRKAFQDIGVPVPAVL
jgi:hypothetical protein